MKVRTIIALALGAFAFATGVSAQQREFAVINPAQPTEGGGKVEVLEFFWYGCIHCYNLEARLEPWVKKLPPDVEFRRVPAVFNDRWAHDAVLFYTFDALGLLDKLHRPFFDAIHRDRLRSDNLEALHGWLEKQGVDPKKFQATGKSFGVQTRTKRAIKLTQDYRIDGTPAMAVHGRYTVASSERMLDTVDQLVAAIRKNK